MYVSTLVVLDTAPAEATPVGRMVLGAADSAWPTRAEVDCRLLIQTRSVRARRWTCAISHVRLGIAKLGRTHAHQRAAG